MAPSPGVPAAPLGGYLVGFLAVVALGAIWTFYLGWLVTIPLEAYYWTPYAAITVLVIVLGVALAPGPKQKARVAIGALAGWLMTLLYLLIAVVHV